MGCRHLVLDCWIGPLTVVADAAAVTGVFFPDHRRAPDPGRLGRRVEPPGDELLASAADQLTEYLDGSRREFTLPLAPAGNAFQRRVWDLLITIPYGSTRTYGRLAAELGGPGLARAVGAANGANPLSILVPCHRVVGTDGTLTGYAGGLARKRALLELERPGGTLF